MKKYVSCTLLNWMITKKGMRDMQRFSLMVTAAAVTVLLAACGGSGSDEGATGSVPEGFWSVSALSGQGSLIVLENGETWGLYADDSGRSGGALHGWTKGRDGSEFSGTAQDFAFGDQIYDVSYSGNFVEKDTIRFRVQDERGGRSFTGAYVDLYDQQPISLRQIAGTYGGTAISNNFLGGIIVNVDANGRVTMRPDAGCNASGQVAPRASGKNVFDLSITFRGTACALGNGTTVRGIALTDGSGLVAMTVDSTGRSGFVYDADRL